MLWLKALGGLAIERDRAPLSGSATQSGGLALLALLAVARERGLTRDKLLSYLWPESTADKARHALAQSLHALRRELNDDALFLGTHQLRLNPERITSDVGEFETALERHELERAVSLYTGPFLDGFYRRGARDFERWIEGERARLAQRAAQALEALATDATARGELQASAEWWRRLATLDPLSGRVALRLMHALAAAGDRAAALRAARVHEALLRHELGVTPDQAVAELATSLREDGDSGMDSTVAASATVQVEQRGTPTPLAAHGAVSMPSPRPHRQSRRVALAGLALGVAGLAFGSWIAQGGPTHHASTVESAAVAVLPFVDLSPDQSQQYVADGIAEELMNALAHVDGLRVVARTSAFAFRGSQIDIGEIGDRLQVSSVVEGSVRTDGNRLRITVQLINVADGYHLWSQRYDRQMKDIFAIQDEISRAVVSALSPQLAARHGGALLRPATQDIEAYHLYLKGRYFWNKRNEASVNLAIRQFEAALARDPTYARAYAGLADCYLHLASGYREPSVAAARAEAAAQRALSIDSTLAEAIASLASVRDFYHWDEAGAESGYRRAIELSPGYATAHHWYGLLLSRRRPHQATDELLRAHQLDPLSLPIGNALALQLFSTGRHEEAFKLWRDILTMDSTFIPARRRLGLAYLALGRHEEAIGEHQQAVAIPGSGTRERAMLARTYAVAGRTLEARRILTELRHAAEQQYVSAYHIAAIHMALGDKERALSWLVRAYEDRDLHAHEIAVDTLFSPLRSDQRFIALLKKMGLDS